MKPRIVFLKLGGSLITNKAGEKALRADVLARAAEEIRSALEIDAQLRLVLGHGSGSFGHAAAIRYSLNLTAKTTRDWYARLEVWRAAHALHHEVMNALEAAGVMAISLPPSASAIAVDGRLRGIAVRPVQQSLQAGWVPVVCGDVVFDSIRGASIVSTEEVFRLLTGKLHPVRILLAGMESGVYSDFPACNNLVKEIRSIEARKRRAAVAGSVHNDVTGGMRSKVETMLNLIRIRPGLEALIFSGERPGNIRKALLDETLEGTRIKK